MVKADMDRQGRAGYRGKRGDGLLHVECGLHRVLRRREQHHDFVADRLDYPALRGRRAGLHQRDALADGAEGNGIAGQLVEPRAVANVREHHRSIKRVRLRFLVHILTGRSV
ncbi:hypothetical protein D3C72_1773840 [compost metagenome]